MGYFVKSNTELIYAMVKAGETINLNHRNFDDKKLESLLNVTIVRSNYKGPLQGVVFKNAEAFTLFMLRYA